MTRQRRDGFVGISERAVKLFRYGLQLQREGKEDSDSFKQVDCELSHELGLKPWEPSVYWVPSGTDEGEEETFLTEINPHQREFYARVIALRRTMIGAPAGSEETILGRQHRAHLPN
jgi:hypothetical protein